MRLIQCIPNFSEGRRPEVIAAITDAISGVEGVNLLDVKPDRDHNRVVVTFVGEPEAVAEAAFLGAQKAAELIDMREHHGEHPRLGATDVIPFVPLGTATMEECVALAEQVGERIGTHLGIPVYLYEKAAHTPERRNLADVRRGQYELLIQDITKPERKPDYGPAVANLRSGGTVVGARPPLVAFNVNLDSTDLKAARAIARTVRESGGGLPAVKALGLMIEAGNYTQISMNLVDFSVTGMHTVLEAIVTEAAKYGVEVSGSEIVGLLPAQALLDVAIHSLKLTAFSRDQVLEFRLGDSK
jgi:glutamate formiminotransferase / 5-formyltetrahydrofolate cyclo-ligase